MGQGSGSDDFSHDDSIFWVSVARARHPVRSRIIKALHQTKQPQSAKDLSSLLEKGVASLEYHLQQLVRFDIVVLRNNRKQTSAMTVGMRTYRLARTVE